MLNTPFAEIGLTAGELWAISNIRSANGISEPIEFGTVYEQDIELEALDMVRDAFINGMKEMVRWIMQLNRTTTKQELLDHMEDAINGILLDTIDPTIEVSKDCEIRFPTEASRQRSYFNEFRADEARQMEAV